MEPIHGNQSLLSILVNGVFEPVLCAIDFTFSCSQQVLLATSADTGFWRRKRLRNLSEWNVSVSGLTKIDNADGQVSFFYLLKENVRGTEQVIQMMFEDSDGNTQVLEGTVLIPELSINGNVSSFADASITFEGTGEVTIEEVVSDVESGVCEDLMSDTWILAEGATGVTGAGQEGRSFAGKEILEVDREGLQHDYAAGAAGNREYSFNGTTVSFDTTNPGNPGGETVFVLWKA